MHTKTIDHKEIGNGNRRISSLSDRKNTNKVQYEIIMVSIFKKLHV